MILKLLDFKNRAKEFEIGELETIAKIDIEIISGDEIAHVVYKDYTTAHFDSCAGGRIIGYPDGDYELYNCTNQVDFLHDPKWISRRTSYSFPYGDWDDQDKEEA